jgi:DNA primase
MLTRLGLSQAEAMEFSRQIRRRGSVEERPTDHPTCPEYLMGPFGGRRPRNLIEAGFTREILDEMEVGFDTARARVIYPIRGQQRQLHGVVGGAVFPENDPNYTALYGNLPKYWAYGKNEGFPFQVNPKWTLWNYASVFESQVDQPVVIVEGFKALMWIRMAGYTNVVSTFGTAYEQAQVSLIAKLKGPYRIFFDSDKAGLAGARSLQKDLRRRRDGVSIVRYPRDVKQPDDLSIDEICSLMEKAI